MDAEKLKHYRRRLKALEQERQSWEAHWKELGEMFLPRRTRFLTDKANDGGKRHNLAHSTPLMAARTLASGMQSGLTNPARPWFRLSLQDAALSRHDAARAWLYDTEQKMTNIFAGSNFYDMAHTLYRELGVFGTGCLVVEEDAQSVVRCHTHTVGEYYLDCDAKGRVNTLYRRLRMTPRQICETWPNAPQWLHELNNKDSAEQHTVVHAIEENTDAARDTTRKDGKSRPYITAYFLDRGRNEESILEEGGYYEFPALCPRWDILGGDVYGASPGMDALADSRMLQKMRIDGRKALNMEVNPPLLAAGLQNTRIDLTPGHVTHIPTLAQGQHGVTPLWQVRANLRDLSFAEDQDSRTIKEVFFNDLFLMISQQQQQMTAREVVERNAEKMLLLGPVLDRLRSELFQPLIERVFGIMQRRGLVAVAPPELAGQELKIEFISLLAQAQKQAGIESINQMIGFVGMTAQMNPEALDKLDIDVAIDEVADMVGIPPNIIRSTEAVQDKRAERQQQIQQQQQMAMVQQGVDMAGGAAKAARDAGMTPDMMQQGGPSGM